jgi:hypothetical protein
MMKTRTLTMLIVVLTALAGAALPCQAQEKGKEGAEPPKETKIPAEPACGFRVLWVDYYCQVPTIYASEYVREQEVGTWEVAYKDVDKVVTEMVLTPKDITREETYTCTEPITSIDPVTGCASTCMQQVTKTRLVKDTIFEMAPKERTIKVPTAYLKEAKEKVPHKYDVYQWRYDNVLKGCAISVPGAMQPNTTHCVAAPMPHCTD